MKKRYAMAAVSVLAAGAAFAAPTGKPFCSTTSSDCLGSLCTD